jgi:hypothetical protein
LQLGGNLGLRPRIVVAWRKSLLEAMNSCSFQEILALGHEYLQLEGNLGLRP